MPERQQQDERDRDEKDDGCYEAEAGAGPLTLLLDSHPAAGAVDVVRTVDRLRIDRRLVRDRGDTAGWLCHPGDSMGAAGCGPLAPPY